MRQLTLIIAFICCALTSYAQPDQQMNGKYQIGTVVAGTTGEYYLEGVFNDERGIFSALDIVVGDRVWDGKCDIYEIVEIHSASPYLEIDVDKAEGTVADPSTSNGLVYNPTNNFDYPLITSGLSPTLLSCVESYRAIKIDETIQNSVAADTRVDFVDVSGNNINFNIIDVEDGDAIIGSFTIPIEDIIAANPNTIVMRGSFFQEITGVTGSSFTWNFDSSLWIVTRNGVILTYDATPTGVTEYGYSSGNITFDAAFALVSGDEIIIRSK